MIAGWMETPPRDDGEGDDEAEGTGVGGRRVSGTLIVAIMLLGTFGLWAGFTWLASSQFDGRHAVTFSSDYPGEVRVQGLPFGEHQVWKVAFLDRYPRASLQTRDDWIEARTDAAWLEAGFFSGRSVQRLDETPGCSYRVQLRGGPRADEPPQVVHVSFTSRHETKLRVDPDGGLIVSEGAIASPGFFDGGERPASEWGGERAGPLSAAPPATDPMLPDLAGLPFLTDD